MLKNLYTPPEPKRTEIIHLDESLFELNTIQYANSRLKRLLSKTEFRKFCRFNTNYKSFKKGDPIIAFYEHVGEDKDFLTDYFNNLKNIYQKSKIFLIIDDCYEGLLTQEDINLLTDTLEIDGWIIATSNLKVKGSNIIPIKYHFYDKDFDNTKIAETKFCPNLYMRNKKFICLNRQERLHRLQVVDFLIEKNLIDHCHVSCQDTETRFVLDNLDPIKFHIPDSEYGLNDYFEGRRYGGIEELQNYQFTEDQKKRLLSNLPLFLEGEDRSSINPKAMPAAEEYFNDSYWAIVTERDFYRSELYEGFTEKTVKCLLFGIPFIIVGLPHTLRHLRDSGFLTFNSFIDESYDAIEDDNKRFESVKQQIEYLSSLNYNDLDLMYKKMLPILEYNYKHLQKIHSSIVSVNLLNQVQLWCEHFRQE